MSAKLVAVWIFGSLSLLLAIWIVQNLQLVIGVPMQSYIFALLIAFVLILLTGLCWISVAVATRKKFI